MCLQSNHQNRYSETFNKHLKNSKKGVHLLTWLNFTKATVKLPGSLQLVRKSNHALRNWYQYLAYFRKKNPVRYNGKFSKGSAAFILPSSLNILNSVSTFKISTLFIYIEKILFIFSPVKIYKKSTSIVCYLYRNGL